MMPNLSEIMTDQTRFLQQNITYGPYLSLNHYMDVQFRLLREDFMCPLREGILCFREMIKQMKQKSNQQSGEIDISKLVKPRRIDSLNVYANVRVESSFLSDNGIVYMIKLDEKSTRSINWQNSKRLMYGSLVCLSSDYFADECMTGTVCMRDPDMLKREGVLVVKFDFEWANENIDRLPRFDCSYTMLENSAYFESYKHVLKALQAFGHDGPDKFPFFDEILFLDSNTVQPVYLRNQEADFR